LQPAAAGSRRPVLAAVSAPKAGDFPLDDSEFKEF